VSPIRAQKKATMENILVNVSEYPRNKDITLLTVKGFIDTATAPEFEKVFKAVLAQMKNKLVFDLKEVDYISSAGWGIFISEIKHVRNQKGDLVLVGMKPEVSEVFELLEFGTILKSFPDIESAVKKCFKDS
jgi:anti-sigma B factor antagonist